MSKKTANAIIQARMGSTRLPGKVLTELEGVPLLGHIVRRLKAVEGIGAVVIATSTESSDDPVASWCALEGIPCVRGSEENVLERFGQAAAEYPADTYIRATGDNPMIDVRLIGDMLEYFDRNDLTYTCYQDYPIGSGVEIFTRAALEEALRCADKPYEIEHVTPYIYQKMAAAKIAYYVSDTDDSGLRMTVDTEEDLRFVTEVFARLYGKNPLFGIAEVKELLSQNPELGRINNSVHQKTLGE